MQLIQLRLARCLKNNLQIPLFLSNKIFKSTEIINSINIQDLIQTKMGTHYRELFNKALNIKKTKLEYIKPDSVNKFETKLKRSLHH